MNWKNLIILILVFSLVLVLYNYIQISKLYINKFSIPTHKTNNNIKITQISDYHSNKYVNIDKIIYGVKDFDPDIIMLTGDIIDFKTIDIDPALKFVEKITQITPKVYFVSGNHEIRSIFYKEFLKGLEDLGVSILDNKKSTIDVNGELINLTGLSFYAGKSDYDNIVENIDSSIYTILLSHSPNRPITFLSGVEDLILSGHTHGGQIRLPFIGAIIAPGQGFFPEYDKGLFKISDTTLYIDSGLGNSVYPIRLFNRIQISNITIESNK